MSAARAILVVTLAAIVSCGRSQLLAPIELVSSTSLSPTCTEVIDAGRPQLGNIGAFDPGCLDVRYTDEMAGELPLLRAALAQWAAPSCTGACFTEPIPFDFIPNQQHQLLLHLDHGTLHPGDEAIVVSSNYGRSRVRDSSSLIRRPGTTANAADYLAAVGGALGFGPTPGVESALNEPHSGLTAADRQSVCSLYPCRGP